MEFKEKSSQLSQKNFTWAKMDLKFEVNSNDLICQHNNSRILVIRSHQRQYHYNQLCQIDVSTSPPKITQEELLGEEIPQLSTGNRGVINNSKYYLFGGKFHDERAFCTFHCLDLKSRIWTNQYESNQVNKIEHSLISIGDYQVIFGGYEGKKIYNQIILYDLKHNKSKELKPTNTSPKHRYGHSAVIHQGEMFIFGGRDYKQALQDMWSFSFLNYEWIQINYTGVIKPLFRHSCIKLEEHIQIFGGAENYQSYSASLYLFNLENSTINHIKKLKEKPIARCLGNIVQVKSKFYLLGGFNGSYISEGYSLSTDLKFCDDSNSNGDDYPLDLGKTPEYNQHMYSDYRTDNSTQSEAINLDNYTEWVRHNCTGTQFTPRTGHSVCCLNECIYQFGGSDQNQLLNDFYEYSINTETWRKLETKGERPSPRSGAKCCVCNDKIYFYGGYTQKNGDYFNDFYCYDPSQKTWKELTLTGKNSRGITDHSMLAFKKYLLIFGGCDGREKYNSLYRIDTSTLTIRQMDEYGEVPIPRFGHTAILYKNSFYIFGGWNGYETQDDLYQYSFISNFWYLEKICYGQKPPARYRHAATVIGDSMFIFGGINSRQAKFNDQYEYCLTKREWKQIEGYGMLPAPRTFHSLVSSGNQIYLVGGSSEDKQNDVNSMAIYHINSISDNDSSIGDQSFCQTHFDLKSVTEESRKNSGSEDERCDIIKTNIRLLKKQVGELSGKLKNEQERNLCIVCYEDTINAVLLECGHKCSCYQCAINFFEVIFFTKNDKIVPSLQVENNKNYKNLSVIILLLNMICDQIRSWIYLWHWFSFSFRFLCQMIVCLRRSSIGQLKLPFFIFGMKNYT